MSETLQEIVAALRTEVGPSGSGTKDGNWQPMIAASEVWALLDFVEPLLAADPMPDDDPHGGHAHSGGVCTTCGHLADLAVTKR